MNGLIRKDLYTVKRQIKSLLIASAIIGVNVVFTTSMEMLGMMFGLLSMIMIMSVFTSDEKYSWDTFAITMPVSKTQIIQARYIFIGIIFGVMFVLSAAGALAFTWILQADLKNTLLLVTAPLIGIIYAVSLLIPVTIKMGPEKSRYIFMALCFAPIILMIVISSIMKRAGFKLHISGEFLSKLSGHGDLILLGVCLTAILLFYISYRVSRAFYLKKEF